MSEKVKIADLKRVEPFSTYSSAMNIDKSRPKGSDEYREEIKKDIIANGYDKNRAIDAWKKPVQAEDGTITGYELILVDGFTRIAIMEELASDDRINHDNYPAYKSEDHLHNSLIDDLATCSEIYANIYEFANESEAVYHAIKRQTLKRPTTSYTLAIGMKLFDTYRGQGWGGSRSKSITEALDKGERKSAEIAAKLIGTSTATAERLRKILDQPNVAELLDKLAEGKSINAIYKEVMEPKEEGERYVGEDGAEAEGAAPRWTLNESIADNPAMGKSYWAYYKPGKGQTCPICGLKMGKEGKKGCNLIWVCGTYTGPEGGVEESNSYEDTTVHSETDKREITTDTKPEMTNSEIIRQFTNGQSNKAMALHFGVRKETIGAKIKELKASGMITAEDESNRKTAQQHAIKCFKIARDAEAAEAAKV